MPAGVDHPIAGYLGFCAIKFAGYSLAARWMFSAYDRRERRSFLVGGARTLIGMAAGAAYFGFWKLLLKNDTPTQTVEYFLGLLPLRIAEWWLLIWIFFDRPFREPSKGWLLVIFATVWSYVLDIPAGVGFLVTGGFWVC
jgi:hypothetical protein